MKRKEAKRDKLSNTKVLENKGTHNENSGFGKVPSKCFHGPISRRWNSPRPRGCGILRVARYYTQLVKITFYGIVDLIAKQKHLNIHKNRTETKLRQHNDNYLPDSKKKSNIILPLLKTRKLLDGTIIRMNRYLRVVFTKMCKKNKIRKRRKQFNTKKWEVDQST